MLTRKENGKLGMNYLEFQIFFGDLYGLCKNEHEVEWVRDNLISYVECVADERIDEISKPEEE